MHERRSKFTLITAKNTRRSGENRQCWDKVEKEIKSNSGDYEEAVKVKARSLSALEGKGK